MLFGSRRFTTPGSSAIFFASARQAIRAAIELQRRYRERTDGEPAMPLGVGMGLDAGEAVPTEGGYRGGALNLAARLCSIALPGQILASGQSDVASLSALAAARYSAAAAMRACG